MIKRFLSWWRGDAAPAEVRPVQAEPVKPAGMKISGSALLTAAGAQVEEAKPYKLPDAAPGVIPKAAKLACDSAMDAQYGWAGESSMISEGLAFLGYPYLSELCQRAEYRRPSEIMAEEMTRAWIKIQSKGEEDVDATKAEKIQKIEEEFERLGVQEAFRVLIEQDGFFGRSQIYLDMGDDDDIEVKTPLSESTAKIERGGLKRLVVIEPMWTYPGTYNSTNPLKADFFKPTTWYVLGKEVHASRLLTLVSREVPDILKPAYAFGGISLSQLCKPYVDNWLRTRQSVSDLINSFTVFGVKTNMSAVLHGGVADDLFSRLELFTRIRNNRGTIAIDKNEEEFFNVSASLSTLDALQAQSQEHMSSCSGIPLVHLTGITPSGLNASSEGELKVFRSLIGAKQEANIRPLLSKVLRITQLHLFGEIDHSITFAFNPLEDANEAEQATTRKTEAETDAVLIDKGIIDPSEARERVARQKNSAYASLDLNVVPVPPEDDNEEGSQAITADDPASQAERGAGGSVPQED